MHVRFAISLFAICLFLPIATRADGVEYTLNNPVTGFTWSFDVPQILTNPDTAITDFSVALVDPGGFLAVRTITTVCSAEIINPTGSPELLMGSPELLTVFSTSSVCPGGIGVINNALTPINSLGTFILTGSEDVTLTISVVPEPSALLLLTMSVVATLVAACWHKRKRAKW
jgi:hypothetical protein